MRHHRLLSSLPGPHTHSRCAHGSGHARRGVMARAELVVVLGLAVGAQASFVAPATRAEPRYSSAGLAAASTPEPPLSPWPCLAARGGRIGLSLANREVSREHMSTKGRSTAEVAVGLSAGEWKREVAAARARGVTAVRVRHILVQTAEMANELRRAVASGSAKFDQLAGMASGCAATRDKGGEVGWSGVDDEHLDEILPR